MNVCDIKSYLVEHDINNGKQLTVKSHGVMRDAVILATSYLDVSLKKVPMTLRIQCILDDVAQVPKCANPKCDSPTSTNNTKFSKYCSRSCSASSSSAMLGRTRESDPEYYDRRNESSARTFQNKAKSMGLVDWESYTHSSHFSDVIDKRVQTHIDKTGYSNNMKSPEGYTKWQDAFKANHGVKHPMHVNEFMLKSVWDDESNDWRVVGDEFKEKSQSTMMARYGVTNPLMSEDIKAKMRINSIERYGRPYPNQSHIPVESLRILNDRDAMSELVADKYFSQVGDLLGVHTSTIQRSCADLQIPIKRVTSMMEDDVANEIIALGFDVERNVKFNDIKREADILIPSKKLIVEFNGMYWHSEEYKYPTYHQHKTQSFHKMGYSVVNVWEDDWVNPDKRNIIINKIKSKLGVEDRRIFARQCTVSLCQRSDVIDFFKHNHIQGHVDGSMYIGLHHDGALVACMTMKDTGNGVFDLSRFASSASVVGGASRCLAFFKRSVQWQEIFTFASLDYSSGDVYNRVGFTKQHTTDPNMWYMKRGQWVRLGRRRFTKLKLPNILEVFDPLKSERQNMQDNGYVRIFDCGSIRYNMINS